MPDISFNLRYIKYAMLAAQCGSFRRVSEMLDVSQSTVSRRIHILERRIGIVLFDRHRSGAKLTAAGERFLRDAAVGAKYLDEAVNAAGLARRGTTGILRIGFMAALGSGVLAELLASFRRRYPSVEMSFQEATSQASIAALIDGRLDVAFMPEGKHVSGCRVESLWDEEIYVAVSQSHPAALRPEISLSDIKDETFLVMADAAGPEIEDYIRSRSAALNFKPNISVQSVGCENLLSMVSQGFGVSISTESTIGNVYPGVHFVPILGSNEKMSFSMVLATSNHNPALKILVALCLDQRRVYRLERRYN